MKRRMPPRPVRKGWECQGSADGYLWWNAAHAPSRDWAYFAYAFLFFVLALSLVLGLCLLAMGYLSALVAKLAMLAVTGVSLHLAYRLASSPSVFRARFDVREARLCLDETQFPNRERRVFVPFADIISLQARQYESWPFSLILHYEEGGSARERHVGGELDERALMDMLASLKPMLADRILPTLHVSG